MVTVTIREYRGGQEVGSHAGLDALPQLLANEATTVWVDVLEPDRETMQLLDGLLELHPLAVDDAVEENQRDKWVHYAQHLFLVCHAAALDLDAAELVKNEIDTFIGDRWLITSHYDAEQVIKEVASKTSWPPTVTGTGVGYLLYSLLQEVINGYFTVLDQFETYYDGAAERVFADLPIERNKRGWFEMRRSLARFDRMVNPLYDGLGSMVEYDLDRFPEAAAPYFRDIRDELRRVVLEVDSLRELVGQIIELNGALQSLRQNTVMKKVGSWAAIIAFPTLVTGFYGMNVPYPGSGERIGVVVASLLSVGGALVLYFSFKRREWL